MLPACALVAPCGRGSSRRAARSGRLVAALAVAVAVLLAGSAAHAIEFRIKNEGLRLDITETLLVSYRGNLGGLITETEFRDPFAMPPTYNERPERRFIDFINKLNVNLQWRRFRLATRFDTAAYVAQPIADDRHKPMFDQACAQPPESAPVTWRNRFCQNYFYPEKLSLEYVGKTFEATLGDFYVSFGRGLVLSLRKIDDFGIDTTLLGGKFVFHEGNTAATLVVGATNIQNVDQATGRFAPDPYDAIAGGRVEYRAWNKVIFGLHATGGVARKNQSALPQKRPDGMMHYGVTIDAPRVLPWLSFYFEGDGQMAVLADQRQHGYALYGSATAYAGPLSLLLEVKHYWKFQRWRSSVDGSLPEFAPIAYNQPPTGERVLTELLAAIYDVSGPRLRIDYRIRPWLIAYGSYAFFDERGVAGGLHYHDPYAGLEFFWNQGRSHLFPSGGYRIERCLTAPDAMACQSGSVNGDFQRIGHVEWDFTQLLPKRLSLEAQGIALFREGDQQVDADGNPAKWTEGNAYFAFKWTPHLIFTFGYEWTTRPSTRINQHFFNGSITWNFTTASSIRIWAGGTRGGLRCISGVCRDFPSLTGATLELIVRL